MDTEGRSQENKREEEQGGKGKLALEEEFRLVPGPFITPARTFVHSPFSSRQKCIYFILKNQIAVLFVLLSSVISVLLFPSLYIFLSLMLSSLI